MAHIYTDVPPSQLTAIARYILQQQEQQALIDAQNGRITSLLPWFPNDTQEGLEVWWEESLDETYLPAVPLRAFDTPVPEGSTPGTTSKQAEMVPMGVGYTIGEKEMHKRRAATGLPAGDILEQAAMNHVERGMGGALIRAELLRAELIVGAQMAIDENGVVQTVTAGRDAGNAYAAGTAWSDTANADPDTDEDAGLDILEGFGLSWQDTIVLANKATVNHYLTLDAVRDSINTVRVLGGRADLAAVNDVRAGRNRPPIAILNRQLRNPAGTVSYMIPDNYWLIVPRPGISVGRTVWGTPAVLDMSDVDIAASERPGPVALIEESDTVPPRRRTVVDALGLPVLQAPNWTVRIDTNAGL